MKNSKPVIIVGGGGHAKVLADILFSLAVEIIGYTAPLPNHQDPFFTKLHWLGDDTVIESYDPSQIMLVNGVGSIGKPINRNNRKNIYDRLKDKGYQFKTVIHPKAIVSDFSMLAEGVQIMAGAVVQPGCQIDQNTIINSRASIDHDCVIGSHVHISPGAVLCGGVQVGDVVHVGAGATLIQNVTVGSASVIGAGAVVTSNVPAGVTMAGVPAKELLKG